MYPPNTTISITFADQDFLINSNYALYWPAQETLIVADLHLEKGSYFAMRGNPLPLYDSYETLKRLDLLIETFQPRVILTLGDNIHDKAAFERMDIQIKQLLLSLLNKVERWDWIVGNHDKSFPIDFAKNLVIHTNLMIDNILFSHDFSKGAAFQVLGHYHPKVMLNRINGKCFLVNKTKIIMPAFGYYTGGFDVNSPHFLKFFNEETFKQFLSYRNKIWRVK